MPQLNTSYEQKYAVVSKSGDMIVLRVLDEDLYNTYWKEFISADVKIDAPPMYLRIEQVPPETVLVDQYADFIPEIPIVSLEVDNVRTNVTDRVVSNTPNTEVPGLYRIDYYLNVTAQFTYPIWSSYVSVQQRPVLRNAAARWVRDSYIVETLNRLVMEPQFMEALHAAGEPLYGFMEANQHPSIKAGNLGSYVGIQAWGAGGAFNDKSNGIFITGARLPQGSVIIYQRRMLQLREPTYPDTFNGFHHMDPNTHKRTDAVYQTGSVIRSGDETYISIRKASNEIPLSDTNYWTKGYLYKFNVLNGTESLDLPKGILPVGKGGVEHIWVTVDDQGYSFWVDIANQQSLGLYRGYYDRKNFADYGPGDIVSYITEDSIRLYRRKATDIQSPETLAYPPGHHLNPAWDTIYTHFGDDNSPLLGDDFVVPHTNATNAIIAKTWSVSEEMCSAYGHMMGIPDLIIKECGAKWSALLFALLSRTRNTFEGLRICFQAVGLDVKNIRLSEPSIAYHCRPNDEPEILVEDIYAQHRNLQRLIANIDSLAPEGQAEAKEGNLRYVTEENAGDNKDEIDVAIQQYSESEHAWITRYRFNRIEPAQNFNNRYYQGDLNILARLAEDAVVDLGDGNPWVKESAWSGKASALPDACIRYEIPIYIFLRLKMWLYAENNIEMQGFVYSGVFDGQRAGGSNIIELFPSKYFNPSGEFITIDTGVFEYDGTDWVEIPYTRMNERGSKIYAFDHMVNPIRIRALDKDKTEFVRYWQSSHTTGLLGLSSSVSTINDVPYNPDYPDHFHNITDPAVTDESDLVLLNGYVGVTALYRIKGLKPDYAMALRWMYILNDTAEEETWALSETERFAEYGEIAVSPMFPFEGSLSELKATLTSIDAPGQSGNIQFRWDGNALVIMNSMPFAIRLKDSSNKVIGIYGIVAGEYTLTSLDWNIYRMDTPIDSVRLMFS